MVDEDRDVGRISSEQGIVLLDMLRMMLVRTSQNVLHQMIVQRKPLACVKAQRSRVDMYACKAEENIAFYS